MAENATLNRIIGWLILAATLVALVMSWYASDRLRGYVACQAEWSRAYAVSTAARAAAAEDDRRALDNMIAAVTEATSPAETRRALVIYQQSRAEADDARAHNPLPQLPDVCQ